MDSTLTPVSETLATPVLFSQFSKFVRPPGYAAQHSDKVLKLVLLAPAYNRGAAADPPAQVPANGAAMNTQSRGMEGDDRSRRSSRIIIASV
jgi:hypothetical protein